MNKKDNKQSNKKVLEKKISRLEKAEQTIAQKKVDSELEQEYQALSKIASTQKLNDIWLQLDNAGLIFPATSKSDINCVFRLSVLMKDLVNPTVLQLAINDIVPRFPSITAAIKKGFFWYYLEAPAQPLVLQRQIDYPCRRMPNNYKYSMIRITYFANEISIEFFHSATDGTGALALLNTLIKRYLELLGNKILDKTNCKNALDIPQPEELEDSYQRIADRRTKIDTKQSRAYHIKGDELANHAMIMTKGVCSCQQLKNVAKEYGVTIGQLINGVYLYALQKEKDFTSRDSKLPLKLVTAVNLRALFPTESIRNFASYMTISSNKSHSLAEMIALTKEQLDKQFTKDYFLTMVNLNVKSQHNFFVKILPLPLKNIAFRIGLRILGERLRSSTMSNLGLVQCPTEFEKFVSRYEFNLGPQYETKVALATITYLDNTVFSFSRTTNDSLVEKYFFRELSNLGINTVIECNVKENL